MRSSEKKRPTKSQKDNKLLLSIEPMIWSILSGYGNLGKAELEDLKQETMIFIWHKVIPKFRPGKAKFSSFTYRCAVNFINRKVKRMNRRRSRDADSAGRHYEIVGERDLECVEDARSKIQYFEDLLSSDNRKHIKPMEMKVVRTILAKPDITQREIANKLGYRYPSAISMMLLRMRRRLEGMNLIQV